MDCDSDGWLMCRRRAAAESPPSSTTATNALSTRISMATPILVSQKFDTAPQIPAFAYTAIAITNGLAGKHWPIAALYPAYMSR